MTKRYRPRRGFNFLLYQDVPMEQVLTDFILRLKTQRKYVTVLRNGLRLMGSLMEKDLSVLDELFPWVRESILASVTKTTPAPSTGDLQQIITATVEASVKAAMLEMPGLPATIPVAAPLKQSGTLGAGKVMALPTFDDDDEADTMVIKEAVNKTNPLENLLAGMIKLDERADREYEEQLAAGNINPHTGRRIRTVQPGLD